MIELPGLTELELAYLAGFIDGEGSIEIAVHRTVGRTRYYLRMQVSNAHREVMQWICDALGGSPFERKPDRARRKPLYLMQVSHITCYRALRLLLPYFRVRTEQAELGIAFHERFYMGNGPRGVAMTPERLEQMHVYALAMKELKGRLRGP